MTKQELRKLMRAELQRHTCAELQDMSAAICRRLLADRKVLEADTILAFWPMPTEPDIRPVIDSLHGMGKRILLPRVTSKTDMVFCPYEGADSMMAVPPYGILEPTNAKVDAPSGNAVMLIPGVSFDADGNRLGHGCGYYDRYLAIHPMPVIPVYFPFQLVDKVPTDKYDINIQTLK